MSNEHNRQNRVSVGVNKARIENSLSHIFSNQNYD